MALAMACELLDVDPRDIRCTTDSIILPRPNAAPITIPARVENSETLGPVGAIVDVPYFGKSGEGSWLTMFDYARYQEPVAHMKLAVFWKLIKRAESIRRTNATADRALKALSNQL